MRQWEIKNTLWRKKWNHQTRWRRYDQSISFIARLQEWEASTSEINRIAWSYSACITQMSPWIGREWNWIRLEHCWCSFQEVKWKFRNQDQECIEPKCFESRKDLAIWNKVKKLHQFVSQTIRGEIGWKLNLWWDWNEKKTRENLPFSWESLRRIAHTLGALAKLSYEVSHRVT